MRLGYHKNGCSDTDVTCRAFTIPELLIAMTIFVLVVGAVVAANFFGFRMIGVTQPKLGASTKTRATVSQMIADISSAKILRIGTGDSSSFTPVGFGQARQGDAIQLHPSTDTNVFVRYFRDTTNRLTRLFSTNGVATTSTIASAVTTNVFTAEDITGAPLTNDYNNMVIGVLLQFYELNGTGTPVGSNKYFKSYQVQTRVTRRSS
jgi:prepilin-type N-terminal cleavage/methylation domain-containing protein